ncbi:type II secretion system protein [Isobaculum melis]|uniref:Type IV pilus assembly protein PilA n=1 Tax=Isobaculum melis TaxID=142588 RepID=A0A1H9S365_9LACT|nr:prepilin-type N-terminal cleavage/methylation domain-containing protein [Isobaculum melis]SER79506.1 type IV pilus assembly protein PilA [Isobaculum melis]
MTGVLTLKEESRMSRILKDEQGMTLVELLATVVILAIIAAIGVTAIGKVIQNTREDAGIANIQQAMNAAKLYQSTNLGAGSGTFHLSDLTDYLDTADATWADPSAVSFEVQDNGSLLITVPAGQLTAGNKSSNVLTDMSNSQILDLDRDTLWN